MDSTYHNYVNWIICGTPVEKIKRIECVKLIFKPQPKKKRIGKRKKDSFDVFHWRTTVDPIYI